MSPAPDHPLHSVWLFADPQPALDAAAAAAVEVCRRHGATLSAMEVVQLSDDPLFETPTGQDLLRLLREDHRQRLDQLRARLEQGLPSGRVVTRFLEGEVAWYSLTSLALRERPDLVIAPADGHASAGPFGTSCQHLFRKCPAPVWSLPAGSPVPRRALVAVDPGAESSDERRLSLEILRVALGFAAPLGMEVHLAHAWSLPGERLISSKLGAETTQRYRESQRENAREQTARLVQQAGCERRLAEVHLPRGEAGQAIPLLAEKLDADMVVVGSAARTGLRGFLIGSVAETILSRLRTSALVVKRPGFESPIRPDAS